LGTFDYCRKQTISDLNKKYPCCIDGQNHAPFEDIGGIFGYLDILDALQDPKHPRYDDYMQIIEDEIGEISLIRPTLIHMILSFKPDLT
jgi:hypothetical protein